MKKFLANDFYKLLNKMFKGPWFTVSLIILFLYRLAYGLSYKFYSTDEIQVFLIGLKNYTTGVWPYFGADVVHTMSRLPGSLQGFAISIPMKIWASPEAPIIFLNMLSLWSLVVLGKYAERRVKHVPSGFIWLMLLTCPWTLNYSTHIINPSYLYIVAVPFFIGVMELWIYPKETLYRKRFMLYMMGLAIMVAAQFHMSAVLLLGFFVATWFVFTGKTSSQNGVFAFIPFILGLATPIIFLVPTFMEFSSVFLGGTENNVSFDLSRLKESIWVWIRGLGFTTFEIKEVLSRGPRLMEYLQRHPLQWLLAVPLMLVSAAHIIYLSWRFIQPKVSKKFKPFRPIFWVSILMIAASFLFSVKGPIGFSFMIVFPLFFVLGLFAIAPLFRSWKMRIVMTVTLIFNLLFHGVYAFHSYKEESLYTRKADIMLALEKGEHTFVGQRRQAFFEQELVKPVWVKDQALRKWKGLRYQATFDDQDLRFWHEQVSENQFASPGFSNPIHKNMRQSIHFALGQEEGEYRRLRVKMNVYKEALNDLRFHVQLRSPEVTIYDTSYAMEVDTSLNEWTAFEMNVRELPAYPDSLTKMVFFVELDNDTTTEVIYLDDMEYHFIP